jgi:hypothetical protein
MQPQADLSYHRPDPAKTLGLTIPATLVARVKEVIEGPERH